MKRTLYSLLLAAAVTGCIKNDLPYPHIQANILKISAEGQTKTASIDSTDCTVTLYFDETANIYQTRITDYSLTPGATITAGDLNSPVDLSEPYNLTVSLYQDYDWTISASRPVERYFSVAGQVGTTDIDVDRRTATAYVSKRIPLSAVEVESFKIAPSNATVTPDLSGKTIDFTSPVEVKVDDYGHTQTWTINVLTSDSPVTTLSADGWTCVGWVYGQAEAGKHNTVQYRIKGNTEWITVPEAWLTVNGGDFNARLTGLLPQTVYEARAVSGDDMGETLEFTTGQVVQMPDSNFDQWWLDGKVWCPWVEGGSPFWGTGNKGASTLGQSNTVPSDDTVDGEGRAAMLQTKFVGIGPFGKLAAGNIFAGSYVRTDGTNGVLSMGREFNQRPTKLRGYLKYKTAPISNTTAGFEDLKGRPDTCIVWVALTDADAPNEIRTNPSNRQLFDENAPTVIAYGKIEYGEDVDAYIPFEITLDYRSTSRVPRYILCTASASKYGDYFTGGNGAVLWVDNFELVYDY